MLKLLGALALSFAILGTATVAKAHSFICTKTVNGQAQLDVSTYPATLHYEFVVINNHYADASTYLSVTDSANIMGIGVVETVDAVAPPAIVIADDSFASIVAAVTATKPRKLLTGPNSELPAATSEPTSEMPEIALVADISGVCNSGGTRVMT